MKGALKIAIIDWFVVFLVLFVVLLVVQWCVPALIVLAVFSAIFAWYYHTHLDVPRTAEEKLVLSNWYAWLERRWKDNPPTVEDAEYYLKHAALKPVVTITFLAIMVVLLLLLYLSWHGLGPLAG
jgi:hypothetical protein